MKIKKVSIGNSKLTLDLSVDSTHSYQLENGTVTHNTLGKTLETTEGIHKPLSKYIFNSIIVSNSSPLLQIAIDANYRTMKHPFDDSSTLVVLPLSYPDVDFDVVNVNEKTLHINQESAVTQLERYKLWMQHYVTHNVSNTISYSPDEVDDIINWLHKNWDEYIGVSFLLRADPTKTAEDLGYPYLPQQPVSKEEFDDYVATLKVVDLSLNNSISSLGTLENDCAGGTCPIR